MRVVPYPRMERACLSACEYQRDAVTMICKPLHPAFHLSAIRRIHPDAAGPRLLQSIIENGVLLVGCRPRLSHSRARIEVEVSQRLQQRRRRKPCISVKTSANQVRSLCLAFVIAHFFTGVRGTISTPSKYRGPPLVTGLANRMAVARSTVTVIRSGFFSSWAIIRFTRSAVFKDGTRALYIVKAAKGFLRFVRTQLSALCFSSRAFQVCSSPSARCLG